MSKIISTDKEITALTVNTTYFSNAEEIYYTIKNNVVMVWGEITPTISPFPAGYIEGSIVRGLPKPKYGKKVTLVGSKSGQPYPSHLDSRGNLGFYYPELNSTLERIDFSFCYLI